MEKFFKQLHNTMYITLAMKPSPKLIPVSKQHPELATSPTIFCNFKTWHSQILIHIQLLFLFPPLPLLSFHLFHLLRFFSFNFISFLASVSFLSLFLLTFSSQNIFNLISSKALFFSKMFHDNNF